MRGKTKRSLILLFALLAFPLAGQAADDRKQFAFDVVARTADTMALMSGSLFYFAELGTRASESPKPRKDTLGAAGFKVKRGGAGMPANLRSEWGSGRP